MKNIPIMKNLLPFIWVVLSLSLIISCEEEKGFVENDNPGTLFRPIQFTNSATAASDTFGLTMGFSWKPIANASYILEISQDSFKFVTMLKSFTADNSLINASSNSVTLSVRGLLGLTRYSARIKSVSKDPSYKDSGFNPITFVTQTENIFTNLTNGIVTSSIDTVRLKWDSKMDVSKIVQSLAGVNTDIILTGADKLAGIKTFVGLSNNSTYTYQIYRQNTILRGTATAAIAYRTISFLTSYPGITISPVRVNKGAKANKPADPIPVDPQYVFVNWYKEAACTNVFNFTSEVITNDITVYAKIVHI